MKHEEGNPYSVPAQIIVDLQRRASALDSLARELVEALDWMRGTADSLDQAGLYGDQIDAARALLQKAREVLG